MGAREEESATTKTRKRKREGEYGVRRRCEDRETENALLAAVAETMGHFNAAVLAYCMMGKHGHSVLHTHRAKLSRLLRH